MSFSDLLAQPDDNGEKHVLLCRVVLGNLEKIDAGSQQFSPSSTAFDNGVDDTVNPKWFVVWTTNMNTHILPECVVSYKCSNVLQGELKYSSLYWRKQKECRFNSWQAICRGRFIFASVSIFKFVVLFPFRNKRGRRGGHEVGT